MDGLTQLRGLLRRRLHVARATSGLPLEAFPHCRSRRRVLLVLPALRAQVHPARLLHRLHWLPPVFTRTSRSLRTVRRGYAYQPPACCTYGRHRVACARGGTHCTYAVHVPASAAPYVPRTVAPQASTASTSPCSRWPYWSTGAPTLPRDRARLPRARARRPESVADDRRRNAPCLLCAALRLQSAPRVRWRTRAETREGAAGALVAGSQGTHVSSYEPHYERVAHIKKLTVHYEGKLIVKTRCKYFRGGVLGRLTAEAGTRGQHVAQRVAEGPRLLTWSRVRA